VDTKVPKERSAYVAKPVWQYLQHEDRRGQNQQTCVCAGETERRTPLARAHDIQLPLHAPIFRFYEHSHFYMLAIHPVRPHVGQHLGHFTQHLGHFTQHLGHFTQHDGPSRCTTRVVLLDSSVDERLSHGTPVN